MSRTAWRASASLVCWLAACTPTPVTSHPAAKASPSATPSSGLTGSRTFTRYAPTSSFLNPNGIDLDSLGTLYVADTGNHRICKVAPDGTVTTLAGGTRGYADGRGAAARFDTPYGVAYRHDGTLFVADTNNHRIRSIAPDGTVKTVAGSGTAGFADGDALKAQFNGPFGLALDALDQVLVADTGNQRIRKIDKDGHVTTLAGGAAGYVDGPLAQARFDAPSDVALDTSGRVYVADLKNHAVRVLDLDGGVSRTLAGNGTPGNADGLAGAARFDYPTGLAVAPDGTVYVADNQNQAVRKIYPNGTVTTLATAVGGATAQLLPNDVAVDAAGDLYLTDASQSILLLAR